MTKKLNKRGFTIVELVVVIVVIAILAAVLIPTISSLVNKANQSADTAAVRQMNEILAMDSVSSSIKNVSDAVKALDGYNINLEDYKPLQKDHYFYFVVVDNRPMVIYTDKEGTIVYPTNVTVPTSAQRMSLSGAVPVDSEYEPETDGSYKLSSGAQLAHLIETKKGTESNPTGALTINLSGNVDLQGAAVDFGKTSGDITIKGAGVDSTVLSGIRADDNTVSPTTGEHAGDKYGFGLFGTIDKGTVTIEDVTITNLVVGNPNETHKNGANTAGLVAGYINSGAKVILKNVIFKDCVVNGYQKVGGIVGQLHGSLEMENVKLENCVVSGEIEVAKIAGYTTSGNLTVESCDFDGITTKSATGNDTFVKADIENMVTNGKTLTLYGLESNTFIYQVGNQLNGTVYTQIVGQFYNSITNDWAWYMNTKDNQQYTLEYRVGILTYQGQACFLNGTSSSASVNFENGKPVTNSGN